jgi:phospholipid/cholesterol/gamma-HCH transport system substrate-binding protein
METRAKYATIGFFTLLVLALAFAFVYWLKRIDETGVRQTMYLEFPGTVSGLEPGGSVYFNGLKVGEVVGLAFKPTDSNTIVVNASVRADTPIKTDTLAKVGSSLLTGVAYIEMSGGSPGAESVFKANPPLVIGHAGGDVMAALNQVAEKVGKIADQVQQLVSTNQEAVTETLSNVREFTGALAKNSSSVGDFLKNVSDLSVSIKALSGRLEGVVDKADQIISAVQPDKIRSVVDNVDKVVKNVADGSAEIVGNIKKTSTDLTQLTDGLKKTLAKIDDTVSAIDKTKIATVVNNVSVFSDKLKTISPDIDSFVADAKKTAANVAKFSDDITAHTGEINQIVADAKEFSGRLNESSKKLDTLLGKANDVLGVEGGKNFFQQANDAVQSIKKLADSLNARVDSIATGIEKFSSRGLENVDALVSELRGTASQINRLVGNLSRDPSSIVFGGNSGVREYNRR